MSCNEKPSVVNPEEWQLQNVATIDAHGVVRITQALIRVPPPATPPLHLGCSSSEGSNGESAGMPSVIHEMAGNKSSGTSSSHDGQDMKKDTHGTYQMATLIHDVYGNGNIGALRETSGFNQVWSFGIPSSLPPPSAFVPQIPLDGNGRPHNVIGRFCGNLNTSVVQAGVTFSQKFAPLEAQDTRDHE
ncbi:hypothetical protein BKA70DRAFT_859094 [Coprinopsis sp. MPI-PUGE-AT-0042]|nr:hypothetical protein BKA70DRAFT_859094 [Coprinopsis sp. MPI-PUGE-AT-0042]